ncbi:MULTISPECIES: metallophosphoesterase [Marinobacter]|mgnify:FL=1|jgi:predicted MPP superfamily phosphohydrolase|uniref:Metallophosphoesterase n=1 Tax=Marinobacter nauticus (strain ATCC 700491 / DSM 11845 / VT8) TaxID=351348 RepID=A1U655_MARN8|nr:MULTISPECIES: metallophosphoesterase [Marinobacter]ABM20474.1 metallophosphoesterase [Marinobacter nauticus VT8]MBH92002.1 metallophosphoesterase [Marinobacter sp.]HCL38221.1 metallophosphoesterase [Marinobacter nauticus]|tara:strand:+ start:2575 stop:3546 length:972 start_codon:yes stop_codon:yes gene_type:complete
MTARVRVSENQDELLHYRLSLRLGPVHARQRLGIERETEARVFGRDKRSFHLENLTNAPKLIRFCLKAVGLLRRAQANSLKLTTEHNTFVLPDLPSAFEGFRILHLTDLHVDMDEANLQAVIRQIAPLDYDLCVLTGDYRQRTWGPVDDALDGMARLRLAIHGDAYAVLGNHDSVRMVPALEDMGYRLLMNEMVPLERGDSRLYLAGVDDAHYYKVHNLHRAGDDIPAGGISLLLSHTPEIWREAAHAGYDLFLCGHTHGGQLCLPGGIPLTLDSDCPRRLGRGLWQVNGMQGYTSPGAGTSVLNVRLNCPPEVTIHTLTRGP